MQMIVNCKRENPVYEAVNFNQDPKNGKFGEKVYYCDFNGMICFCFFLFFLLLTFWLCYVNVMLDCEFFIWFLGSILCRDYQKLVSLEKSFYRFCCLCRSYEDFFCFSSHLEFSFGRRLASQYFISSIFGFFSSSSC